MLLSCAEVFIDDILASPSTQSLLYRIQPVWGFEMPSLVKARPIMPGSDNQATVESMDLLIKHLFPRFNTSPSYQSAFIKPPKQLSVCSTSFMRKAPWHAYEGGLGAANAGLSSDRTGRAHAISMACSSALGGASLANRELRCHAKPMRFALVSRASGAPTCRPIIEEPVILCSVPVLICCVPSHISQQGRLLS